MPKKTRREKIIAELRRKLAVTKKTDQEVRSGPPASLSADKADEAGKIEARPETSRIAQQNQASNILLPTSYLKKDLTKTFTLAILAISLELVLYFWLG